MAGPPAGAVGPRALARAIPRRPRPLPRRTCAARGAPARGRCPRCSRGPRSPTAPSSASPTAQFTACPSPTTSPTASPPAACSSSCTLMHPQSGDTTPQQINPYYPWPPWKCPGGVRRNLVVDYIRKVVVSDHIVAVRTHTWSMCTNVSIHARGGAGMKWWVPHKNLVTAEDIALFQGKLYILIALSSCQGYELHVLDVTGVIDEQGGGGVRSVQCISVTPIPRDWSRYSPVVSFRCYLVASGDRLLMVEQTIGRVRFYDRTCIPSRFEVFEAADLSSGHGRWSKVDTLMGRALFVSEGCSESLPAGSVVGAREDCIYFMSEREISSDEKVLESGVYNMREGTTVRPLPPLETLPATLRDGPWSPTWLFPVET